MRENRAGSNSMARGDRVVQGPLALAMAAILLVCAGCSSPPGGPAPRVEPAAPARVTAEVEPILRPMCDALDGAKTCRFRVYAVMDRPTDTGQLAQFHRTSDITVARPDRIYQKTRTDEGDWSAWYSGGTLTLLSWDTSIYATESVPNRIDGMLDYMVKTYDLVLPMADLLAGKTYESLLANVESSSYLGLHAVGRTPCHHLLMRQENIDWQIWIDAGQPPMPRKLVITYKLEPGQPQYVATIDNWDLSPAISQETFRFTPPATATAVSMSDLLSRARGEQP